MPRILATIALLAICPILFAQETLSDDSVIRMIKAGISDDLIISTINESKGTFDTSVDAIIALKTAGASDKLVSAILLRVGDASHAATARPSPQHAAIDSSNPMSRHAPGIYMLTRNRDGSKNLIPIDPIGSQLRETNLVGNVITEGISSAKVVADIPGVRANVRTSETRPEFYFYFPPAGTIGLPLSTTTNPRLFTLRMLEINKDHRVTLVAKTKWGMFQRPKQDKFTITFTSEMIRPSVFRVIPSVDLSQGEYAFTEEESERTGTPDLYGGIEHGTVYSMIFDFGVD